MLSFTIFAGVGIVGFFSLWLQPEKKEKIILIVPIIGYVFSQVLYYQWYYIFENSSLSLYLTIASICLVDLIYIIIEKRKNEFGISQLTQSIKKIEPRILIVLLVVFILSSWQYILIGQGHYYHSGNEDYFDAVNGGDVYLANTPTRLIFYDIRDVVRFTAVIKYQYSSQAFWRLLLNVGGVDGFLLQGILNLLLTIIGVFWLVRYVFKSDNKIALWISFWSVAASFYFSTFMTGHVGSLMYVSVVGVFIGLILLWIRKEINWIWLLMVVLFYYFLDNTYPGPMLYILIPLAFMAINERVLIPRGVWNKILNFFGITHYIELKSQIRNIKYFRVLTLLIILIGGTFFFLIYMWNNFEPDRIRTITRGTISWKISLFKEMFMIFWGIYPPGSTGTTSILPLFINSDYINTISLILALIISILTFFAVIKCRKWKEKQFITFYGILFIPYFVMMRYFWGSSYYIYKFLYIHMFLIVIALLLWLNELPINWTRLKKRIVITGFIILGFLNIAWDISLGLDFYFRPYNNKEKISNFFDNVSPELLSKSYLDIPNEVNNLAFRYIFADKKITPTHKKNEAKYIIRLNNVGNALYNSVEKSNPIFDNGLLSIQENLKENNISLKTLYDPNNSNGLNINWIGNEMSKLNIAYKEYIQEAINYIKTNNIKGECYLDIAEPELYFLFYRAFEENNIKINIYPDSSVWFIRRKFGLSLYQHTIGEFRKWQNTFFSIDYVPPSNRTVNPPFLEAADFTTLINYIKNNGNSVYLDIPNTEPLYIYLKQVLLNLGLKICDYPKNTDLFFRTVLYPPYDKFNSITVKNSNEKLIGRARENQIFRKIYWDVELVNIPQEGRSYINTLPITTIPFRILTSIDNNDLSITLNNVTKEAKYLRILLEPGPSIDFSNFVLDVRDESGITKKFQISPPQTLINLPLEEFKKENGNLHLSFFGENLIGKSLLPLEERYLNYIMLGAELTDNIDSYSPIIKRILNRKPFSSRYDVIKRYFSLPELKDIIDIKDTSFCYLGLGWCDLETADDQSMRWVSNQPAEIVLDKIDKKHNIVNVGLEPGPGCGSKPLNLKIYNRDRLIKEEIVTGQKNVEIQLPDEIYKNNKEQIILKLVAETENAKIASDPRVMNFRVFNISLKKAVPQQKTIVDKTNFDKISLGDGWFPFETYSDESFQWVGKEPAEIVLKDIDEKHNVVQLNLEPGPGCGGKPLRLKIYNKERLIKEEIVSGRKNIDVQLPEEIYKNNKEQIILKLVTKTENVRIASDPRILNYRVFNISLKETEPLQKTIIDKAYFNKINLGNGWYPFEVYDSKSFQWVGRKPAEIIFNNFDNNLGTLRLDLEPGPSCGGESLKLDVYINDKLINKNKLLTKTSFEINLKNNKNHLKVGNNIIKLVPSSKNIKIPGDPRTLNFRVFNINYIQQ